MQVNRNKFRQASLLGSAS